MKRKQLALIFLAAMCIGTSGSAVQAYGGQIPDEQIDDMQILEIAPDDMLREDDFVKADPEQMDEETADIFDAEEFTDGSDMLLANQAEPVLSGNLNQYLTWQLEENGTLVIRGEGDMPDYNPWQMPPWAELRDRITGIQIQEGVTKIGNYAFHSCEKAQSLEIKGAVSSIGNLAFHGCKELEQVSLELYVKEVGEYAFEDCSSIKELILPVGMTNIGKNAFRGCTTLSNVELPGSLNYIGAGAFADCPAIVKLELPEGVTRIESDTFKNCSGMTEISLPENLLLIDAYAFEGCTSLGKLTLPNTVTEIRKLAFAECGSLTNLVLPEKLQSVGSAAFQNCGFMWIDIPKGVYSIAEDAFIGCNQLKRVLYRGTEEAWNAVGIPSARVNDAKVYFNYDPAHTHEYEDVAVITPPTCTQDGVGEYICRFCGEASSETRIPATGHKFGEWHLLRAATVSSPEEQIRGCLICSSAYEMRLVGKPLTPTVKAKVVKTKKITKVPSRITLKVKKSRMLRPVLKPKNSTQKITYKSSNKKIVTVNKNGKITAKRKGTAVITVRSGKYTVKCRVTVKR